MKFAGFQASWWQAAAAVSCAALLSLAGCGGGTQVESFHPSRVIAFGDEASVIGTDHRKYTVNALTSSSSTPPNVLDCASNPIWVQSVAGVFGLTFQNCPGTDTTKATGLIEAQPGAKVADVKTQVDNYLATGASFSHDDLVTVMAGTHDVLEQFALYPATPADALESTIKQRARDLAAQVNRIAATGAPVMIVRIPDVGATPYAKFKGTDAQALMSKLTLDFNTELQLNLINDGHLIGLVFGDTEVKNLVDYPSAFGLANTTQPACATVTLGTVDAAAVKACDASTLVTVDDVAATSTNFLWAGNVELGPTAQSRIGFVAASRAQTNPF